MSEKKFDLFEDINLNKENEKYFEISNIVAEIVARLVSKRLELGVSQRELAKRTDIKQPMIARIEKFESIPRLDTLVKIALALDLKINLENKINSLRLELMNQDYANEFFNGFIDDPILHNEKKDSLILCDNVSTYNYLKKQKDKGYILLAIIYNDEVVGEIRFKNIESDSAEIGIILKNDQYKGKGIGTEAIFKALNYASDTLKLKRIKASILHNNKRSIHVFEKVGFIYEKSDDVFKYYYKDLK